MTLPERALAQAINQRTGLDVDRAGGTNTARRQPCPRCHATTLVGLNDNIAAFTIRADPRLLTRSDEVTALLSGRATLHLRSVAGRPQLRRRDHHQILGHPADTTDVVAEHLCGVPLGRPIPRTPDTRSANDQTGF